MAEPLVSVPMGSGISVRARAGRGLPIPVACVEWDDSGRVLLEMSGLLPEDWAARLARGCAARRISWESGHARRSGERWEVRLGLDASLCSGRVPDFLELATRGDPGPHLAEPPLLEVALGGSGDALELEVHAWDAVGLIAAVLDRVERAGLRVRSLLLETEDECAFHQITAVLPNGRSPGWRERRALLKGLSELLHSA